MKISPLARTEPPSNSLNRGGTRTFSHRLVKKDDLGAVPKKKLQHSLS
jgi:hypothetical protein